jgi:hypothetical protein
MKHLSSNRVASSLDLSRAFKRSLLLFPIVTLAACSGGGGSSSSSGTTTQTGSFIDSPVQGLTYVTGGVSAETGPGGEFSFEAGAEVEFYVGDILVGMATGATVLTPVDLVAGATDETNDEVTNICRFLQTLDDNEDPSDGILITAQAQASAAGQTLNFAQTPEDFTVNAETTIAEITSNSLVTAGVAQEHFAESLLNSIAGVYNGSYSGDDSGQWQFTVAPDGSVHGWGYSTLEDDEPFQLFGALTSNGSTDVEGNLGGGLMLSGQISGNSISGTWSGDGEGAFQGSRTSAAATSLSPDLMTQLAGSYTGTVSGDEIEPLTVEIDSNGSVVASIPGDGVVAWCVITSTTSTSASFVGSSDYSEVLHGTVGTDGALVGTWHSSFDGESGTFSAQKD